MCAVTQQPPPPPPPGQPPYGGGYPPNQYGAPPFGGYVPPDHHQAVTVLILGILGLVLCQVISPFAWVMGNRVVREIDASNGQVGGRGTANAGRICGIVGTFLLAAGVVFAVVIIIIALAGVSTSSTNSPY
jgi:uncharacterized membrane protein YjgN (DUF898 family)